jgi:hypothetical protein
MNSAGPCKVADDDKCKLSNLNELIELLRYQIEEIRRAQKPPSRLDELQKFAGIFASIVLPLVILFVGQQYNAASARTSLRVSHANLLRDSIGELTSDDPSRQALAVVGIRTALTSSDDPRESVQAKRLLGEIRRALQFEIESDIETARLRARNHSALGDQLLQDTRKTIEEALTVRMANRGIGLIHAARETVPEMVTPESRQELKRAEAYLQIIIDNPNEGPLSRVASNEEFKLQVKEGLDRADAEWKELMAAVTAFLDKAAMVDYSNTTANALIQEYNEVHNKFISRVRSLSSPPELLRSSTESKRGTEAWY